MNREISRKQEWNTEREGIFMENNGRDATEITHCNQCPNHCPLTSPRCGKGRRYAESLKQAQEPVREELFDFPRWQKKRGERIGRREGGRGEHGGWEKRDDLTSLLRRCGHILHHRQGGGRGGQNGILRILAERGEMSQRELQEILRIQPGSMSEILAKLERKGFLIRQREEEDRRKSLLRITEAGRAEADARTEEGAEEDRLYDCLSGEEKEVLRALLKKVLQSWEEPERQEQE
ncbi:MAG: MarR family transcriptional regulator [Eubacteriales bacterium]|nr:MarR family transcriptional regulator [Eubacteriales bacterium]